MQLNGDEWEVREGSILDLLYDQRGGFEINGCSLLFLF